MLKIIEKLLERNTQTDVDKSANCDLGVGEDGIPVKMI